MLRLTTTGTRHGTITITINAVKLMFVKFILRFDDGIIINTITVALTISVKSWTLLTTAGSAQVSLNEFTRNLLLVMMMMLLMLMVVRDTLVDGILQLKLQSSSLSTAIFVIAARNNGFTVNPNLLVMIVSVDGWSINNIHTHTINIMLLMLAQISVKVAVKSLTGILITTNADVNLLVTEFG
jgi:hypothetical protein